MKLNSPPPSSTRLRRYLAAGYALLIVYASLFPFAGWKEQGLEFGDVLTARLSLAHSWFDLVINVIAYLPLGLLLGLMLRARAAAGWAVLLATAGGMALSVSMEYAQMYLPGRISSNVDLLANSCGTLLGALMATFAPQAWLALLARARAQMFRAGGDADFGLALLALWALAQINPALPMLGNVFISQVMSSPFLPMPPAAFSWLESGAMALNVLMVGCLLLTLRQRGSSAIVALVLILCAVALAKFIAAALLLKSWALLLWLHGGAVLGIVAGLMLVAFAGRLPYGVFRWYAGMAAATYIGLTQGFMESGRPASAQPLYYWHYGHLLNYNVLSQTILLVFPLLLLGYLWHIRERSIAV